MKVHKFGGTSVGSPERIKDVVNLMNDGDQKLMVVSAMAGTTNTLVELCQHIYKKDFQEANEIVTKIELKYDKVVKELLSNEDFKETALNKLKKLFNNLRSLINESFSKIEEKIILAQGELISSMLIYYYMKEVGIKVALLPALEFMKIDKNGEPVMSYIQEKLKKAMDAEPNAELYLTQGYICRNINNEIDNLRRGGSDYTASILGALLKSEEICIWTDIDGLHNNDPRYVHPTKPVRNLHFEEASELAYFGSKILHPTCILPAKENNIPVRLLNTMEPEAEGTLISGVLVEDSIKAIAAKDDITVIRIKSSRILVAHSFLFKVFEAFESYHTHIDMITTSEVGVSVTIDDTTYLDEIVIELKKYGSVTVEKNMAIICIVGDLIWDNIGFESNIIFEMKDIPIRMISYGGSNYNVSLLVKDIDKVRALEALNNIFFEDKTQQ